MNYLLVASFAATLACHAAEDWARVAADAQRTRNYSKAAHAFEQLIKEGNSSPELLSNAGVMLHMAGRDRDAAGYLRTAVALKPDLVSAYLFLGLSLIRTGDAAEALGPLERASELQPSAPLPLLGLGRAHVALRQLNRANAAYYRASRADAGNAEAWFGLGITYRSLLESAVSRLAATALLKTVSAKLDAPAAGSFNRADFVLALEQAQGEAASPDNLARLTLICRDLSLEALNRAVQLDPDSERTHLLIAESLRDSGKFTDAIREYQVAIRLRPDSIAARLGLAVTYWKTGESESVWEPLNEVLRLSPEEPQANVIKADLLARRGDYDGAKRHADIAGKATEIPDHLRVIKAKIHLSENHAELAAAELEAVLASDLTGQRHYLYSQILRKLGRNREAAAALESYRRLKGWNMAAGELRSREPL